MDFADRLAEVLYDAWGMKVTGSFAAAGGLVFNAGVFAAPHEEADYQEGKYSFYYCERASRGAPLFQTTNRHVFDHCVLQNYGNPLRIRYGFPKLTLGDSASIPAKRAIFACSPGSLTWLSIHLSTCWSATCVRMPRRFYRSGFRSPQDDIFVAYDGKHLAER